MILVQLTSDQIDLLFDCKHENFVNWNVEMLLNEAIDEFAERHQQVLCNGEPLIKYPRSMCELKEDSV